MDAAGRKVRRWHDLSACHYLSLAPGQSLARPPLGEASQLLACLPEWDQEKPASLYAIQFAFPRWRHIWYAVAAFLAYPFEDTRDKLSAVARAFIGDRIYRAGKRVLGSRMQARGQE